MVELVAARPPPLELRLEEVDEPLGITKLGRRHPMEGAMPQELGRAECVWRDDRALDLALVVDIFVAWDGDRRAVYVFTRRESALAVLGVRAIGLLAGHALPRRGFGPELSRHVEAARSPEAVEDMVIDLAL